jgi:hypothetical protein
MGLTNILYFSGDQEISNADVFMSAHRGPKDRSCQMDSIHNERISL